MRTLNESQERAKQPGPFGQSSQEQLDKIMPIMLQVFAGMQMSDIASYLKHPSFSEEREWRIVLQKDANISYRAGTSFLTPFVLIPLALLVTHALVEVVVGPTPHRVLSVKSVEECLLMTLGRKVPVRPSNIPFRAW